MPKYLLRIAWLALLTLVVAAGGAAQLTAAMTPITLQLQWLPQSQFCGYFVAQDKGFWKDVGLHVTIKPGAVDIVPQEVVATGGAEFGVAWLPKALASIEQGANLVNIAQVFQRSGTLAVSWKDSGITRPADWRGKKVGTWGFGNEPELFAAMRQAGIDPANQNDVTIVQQPFDMLLLLNRQVDTAQAMSYNEYAQVLEAVNPQTGQLYQPGDLHVINFNDVGTAMLQDGIFVRGDWITDARNQDSAVKFLQGAFKGWMYCRDNFDEAVTVVLANRPTLGKGHMTWQLNEINKLIWPSPNGLGIMDPVAFNQTARIAQQFQIIKAAPRQGVYRTDLAHKALETLPGADVKGLHYQPRQVQITRGKE